MEPVVKQKTCQVDEQCEFLDKSIAALARSIEELEDRLGRILRPLELEESKPGEEISLVPFAEYIRAKSWNIQSYKNCIDSILFRLEI